MEVSILYLISKVSHLIRVLVTDRGISVVIGSCRHLNSGLKLIIIDLCYRIISHHLTFHGVAVCKFVFR